jgi:hypothetical protein
LRRKENGLGNIRLGLETLSLVVVLVTQKLTLKLVIAVIVAILYYARAFFIAIHFHPSQIGIHH